MIDAARQHVRAMLTTRLAPKGLDWLEAREAEITAGIDGERLATLVSLASRFAPRGPLAPTVDEISLADAVLPGWNPERWTCLEALRVALVLAWPSPEDDAFPGVLEECFKYADEGELCGLHRALQFLPAGERFTWRAGEAGRSNMQSVFEANGCDTAYPAKHLDDIAWRQLCIKAVFIGAPLWRVSGLDGRLDDELARIALDLEEERRSAGRAIQPDLWLCLGAHAGERGLAAIERELAGDDLTSKQGAVLALGRAGASARLEELVDDPELGATAKAALAGDCTQAAWRALTPAENEQ